MNYRAFLVVATISAALAALAGPACAAESRTGSDADPWEGANRGLFSLNKGLDRAFLRPSATFYHHAVPTPARAGVHNALYNLGEPVTFLNNVLQARPRKAGRTAVRFVVNSTVGILGLIDVTGDAGMKREPSGFSDTLARYGVGQGPYIFIPLFGPSSVRDLTGRIVDVVSDPLTIASYEGRAAVQTGRTVAGGLDRRVDTDATLKEVDRTATDPYATIRSAFLQSSASRGKDEAATVKDLPDFGPDSAAPPPQPAPKTSTEQPKRR